MNFGVFVTPNTTMKLRPHLITPTRLSTHVSRPTPICMRAAMALLNYFKKAVVETLPDPHGQLLAKIPSTIVKSNRQVLVATEKERRQGEYKISPKNKATITKYASEHGVAHAALGDDVQVKVLLEKNMGKTTFLGEKLDKYLQELIVKMCSRGTLIGSTIVVAIACGILLMHNKTMLEEFEVQSH